MMFQTERLAFNAEEAPLVRAPSISVQGQKQTCTRHVGGVIALSIEPFYNPSGRSSIGS